MFFEVVFPDARPAALPIAASYADMLEDARRPALLALASYSVAFTDARPAALLAAGSFAVVLTDARPAGGIACSCSYAVRVTDAPAAPTRDVKERRDAGGLTRGSKKEQEDFARGDSRGSRRSLTLALQAYLR